MGPLKLAGARRTGGPLKPESTGPLMTMGDPEASWGPLEYKVTLGPPKCVMQMYSRQQLLLSTFYAFFQMTHGRPMGSLKIMRKRCWVANAGDCTFHGPKMFRQ